MTENRIRTAHSCAPVARVAAHEFHVGVNQPDMALVVFFCSSLYDLDALAEEMNRLFAGVPVVGCTTAGEIGPAGYRNHSLTGASFPAGTCTAHSGRLDNLQGFKVEQGYALTQELTRQLEGAVPVDGRNNRFALLLIDGLSVREEPVTRTLQHGLGRIPVIGGSAGDDLKFAKTWIFHDGAFHTDSAVLTVVTTSLPVTIFKTQHFVSTDERLVVTDADTARRVVHEINGLPASEEYARLIGTSVGELEPMRYAASPVVVLIDGADYVRSIQKINADRSLTLYCAIDEGVVLRVARGVDLVSNLEQAFARVHAEIGPPQLVFACDCILRALELAESGAKEAVGEILRRNNAIGFSTYGEQFGGVHVNQTLTGVAIGRVPAEEVRE